MGIGHGELAWVRAEWHLPDPNPCNTHSQCLLPQVLGPGLGCQTGGHGLCAYSAAAWHTRETGLGRLGCMCPPCTPQTPSERQLPLPGAQAA